MNKLALTCILLLFSLPTVYAQKKLDFYVFEDYEYVLKIDPQQTSGERKLIRSQDPALRPWLPENQIGWQIQDQNYFDLFLQHTQKPQSVPINFYKYVALAIVQVDYRDWSFRINEITYDAENNNVHVSYRAQPYGPQISNPKASTVVVLIEQNRQIQKAGMRNLDFSVSVNDGAIVSNHNSSLSIFPLAYTSEQYYTGNEMVTGNGSSGNLGPDLMPTRPDQSDNSERPDPDPQVVSTAQPDYAAIEAEKKRQEAAAEAEAQRKEAEARKEAALLEAALNAAPATRPIPGQSFFEPQGYMVKKSVRLEPSNYLLIENIYEWDIYLKSVPPGMTPITPITADDFLKYYAVAIIKHEKRYWEMSTISFETLGDEAKLDYGANITLNNMNWTATVAHIIMVERGQYDTINLYENDRRVGILSVR